MLRSRSLERLALYYGRGIPLAKQELAQKNSSRHLAVQGLVLQSKITKVMAKLQGDWSQSQEQSQSRAPCYFKKLFLGQQGCDVFEMMKNEQRQKFDGEII